MRVVFKVDPSAWPLVRTEAAGDVDDEALEAFMAEMTGLSARMERYGNVLDISKLGSITSAQRARYAEYLKRTFDDHKKYCVAVGVVAPSMVVRGIMTAISWLHPFPHATKFCATAEEAEKYVRGELTAAGIAV